MGLCTLRIGKGIQILPRKIKQTVGNTYLGNKSRISHPLCEINQPHILLNKASQSPTLDPAPREQSTANLPIHTGLRLPPFPASSCSVSHGSLPQEHDITRGQPVNLSCRLGSCRTISPLLRGRHSFLLKSFRRPVSESASPGYRRAAKLEGGRETSCETDENCSCSKYAIPFVGTMGNIQ